MKLPRPYPDELIGSIVARGMVRSGLPHKKFKHFLFGPRGLETSYFLPTALEKIARRAAVCPMKLLWEHTALPYVAAFKAKSDAALLARRMRFSSVGSLASLVQSATEGCDGLRFCPQCLRSEMDMLGESYWHRSHNLPGVHVCTAHGCTLQEVRWLSAGRAVQLGQPHHHTAWVGCHYECSPQVQMQIARTSEQLLHARTDIRPDWTSEFRHQAALKGYGIGDHAIATVPLARDLSAFFTSAWLSRWNCSVTLDANAWPSRLLRPGTQFQSSTFRHILLQVFLEQVSAGEKDLGFAKPGKVARNYATLDEALARRVHENLAKLMRAGARVPVRELFSGSDLLPAWRHDRSLFPLTTTVVETYRASPIAERQAGGRPRVYTKVGIKSD